MVCHIQIYLGGTDEQLGYMVTGIFDKYSADVVWQYCVICAGLLLVCRTVLNLKMLLCMVAG